MFVFFFIPQLDNHEIKPGKNLKVNISVPNLRLFVGNIPKSKGKEEILEEFGNLTGKVNWRRVHQTNLFLIKYTYSHLYSPSRYYLSFTFLFVYYYRFFFCLVTSLFFYIPSNNSLLFFFFVFICHTIFFFLVYCILKRVVELLSSWFFSRSNGIWKLKGYIYTIGIQEKLIIGRNCYITHSIIGGQESASVCKK